MPKPGLPLLLVTLLLPGCALFRDPLPVSASCPPPPQIPQAVVGYATPEKNLIEESGALLLELRNDLAQSLKRANGQPM